MHLLGEEISGAEPGGRAVGVDQTPFLSLSRKRQKRSPCGSCLNPSQNPGSAPEYVHCINHSTFSNRITMGLLKQSLVTILWGWPAAWCAPPVTCVWEAAICTHLKKDPSTSAGCSSLLQRFVSCQLFVFACVLWVLHFHVQYKR